MKLKGIYNDYFGMKAIIGILKTGIFLCVLGMLNSCSQNKETTIKKSYMENNGLVIKKSQLTFEATYEKLRNIIDTNPNLKIILELDHSKNAASKDLELRPTRILIFGNPMLGTPLMQNQPTLAIDLPQKVLVYQENNEVFVVYNNPSYLKERHAVEGKDEVLTKITGALHKITDAATGN